MTRNQVPIFIISYNRLTVLERSIKSYLKFSDYPDIIIIDKGSSYPPLKEYYKDIEAKGSKIIYSDTLKTKDALSDVAQEIARYKLTHDFDYYIVTDPDICFEEAEPDILELYIDLLDQCPNVEIVGPMLKIVDIPQDYPAREWCWKRQVDFFWRKRPITTYWRNKKIHYQLAPIDTTFGVIRATTRYKRLLNGIRVYTPYEASHLDWYITNQNMTEDQYLYMKTANPDVAHWCGLWYHSSPDIKLLGRERDIFIVTKGSNGEFFIKEHKLPALATDGM